MKPQKLGWITVPLLIMLVMQVLGLIALPFVVPLLSAAVGSAANDPGSGLSPRDLSLVQSLTGTALWLVLLLGLLWAALIYFTSRAVSDGKSWGRVAAIVIAVLGLLNFPIGTVLGVLILVGAFDPEVQRFFSR